MRPRIPTFQRALCQQVPPPTLAEFVAASQLRGAPDLFGRELSFQILLPGPGPERGKYSPIMALHREAICKGLSQSQVDLGLCSITAVPSLITDAYFAPVFFLFTFFFFLKKSCSACKSLVAGLGVPNIQLTARFLP